MRTWRIIQNQWPKHLFRKYIFLLIWIYVFIQLFFWKGYFLLDLMRRFFILLMGFLASDQLKPIFSGWRWEEIFCILLYFCYSLLQKGRILKLWRTFLNVVKFRKQLTSLMKLVHCFSTASHYHTENIGAGAHAALRLAAQVVLQVVTTMVCHPEQTQTCELVIEGRSPALTVPALEFTRKHST